VYQDNSLLPREAIRLAALGILAGGPVAYARLAAEVRHFASRIAGPSPELMGTSIELLVCEGLIAHDGLTDGEEATLILTDEGREELHRLLHAGVRAPFTDVNKLILALKFRFLHLLPAADRKVQVAMTAEAFETELARLVDLRATHAGDPGYLVDWLDHEIAQGEARLTWLDDLEARLGAR
jgi:DNA-binding PadR family transcriptional regulator